MAEGKPRKLSPPEAEIVCVVSESYKKSKLTDLSWTGFKSGKWHKIWTNIWREEEKEDLKVGNDIRLEQKFEEIGRERGMGEREKLAQKTPKHG